MRQLLTVLMLLVATMAFAKPGHEAIWQKGNSFYQQKQYDSAIVYYEQLVAQRIDEAALYYNLGNAYYRLNQVGPAILNYERSLQLDPLNKQTRENLSLAQNQIINRIQPADDIFFVTWWKALTHAHLAQVWAVAGLVLFIAFIVLLLARRMGKINTRRSVIAVVGIVWLAAMSFAFVSAMHKADSRRAVVMQQDAPLVSQPNEHRNQSLIPEGTTVSIRSEEKGWYHVSLPDGRKGWMQQDMLARI